MTAQHIIELLGLQPHPTEGGYYRETYRSEETIPSDALPKRYSQSKSFGTAIYYLLIPHTCSLIHRLPTDELFHFYLGNPVIMLMLRPDLTSEVLTLGHDLDHGHQTQVVVPRDTWQGSLLSEGGTFSLLGTTMAPGFDFSDYEYGNRDALTGYYPERTELIQRLTK